MKTNKICLESKQKIEKRQARLNAWLALNETNRIKIAADLGISAAYVGLLLNGKRLCKRRFDELVKYGIPADLLPTPKSARARGVSGEDSGVM